MSPRPTTDALRSESHGHQPRVSPRAFGLVAGLVLAGAMIGATNGVTPSERVVGEAVVAIQLDGDQSSVESRRATVATAATSATVLRAAALEARSSQPTPESLRQRVSIAGDPAGGFVRVRARDRTAASARGLAAAVAAQAVLLLRRSNQTNLTGRRRVRSFSFENGVEGWRAAGSRFSIAATRLSNTARGRIGDRALIATCGEAGCGPSVSVSQGFLASVPVRAAAYVRATRPGVSTRLVLGSGPSDVAVGTTQRLRTTEWRLLTVIWTPRSNAGTAELALQTTNATTSRVSVDGATIGDDLSGVDQQVQVATTGAAVQIRARRAAAEDRYAVIGPAIVAGEIESRTLETTLVGAVGGLLVALAGLSAAALAQRRKPVS